MRLIDADATIELLRRLGSRDYRREKGTIMDAMKMLSHAEYTPTIFPEELRKKGKWKNFADKHDRGMDLCCSICNNRASNFVGGTEDWWDMWKPYFCPNCGAKMEEE